MDVLDLLARARAAGLTVHADGGKLIVRGPKSAEALARELGAHKAELLALLARESTPPASPVATADNAICPDCGATSARLGSFTLDDGRGRFQCPRCDRVFWSLPGQIGGPPSSPVAVKACPRCGGPVHIAEDNAPGFVTFLCDDDVRCRWAETRCVAKSTSSRRAEASLWADPYGDIDDDHYQAVVDADIARHGFYVPTRQYAEPSESVEAIWQRAGLPVLRPIEASDHVFLTRPDGGVVNVLEAWKIDAIIDSCDGKLALFLGRPYASWPVAFCRRASAPM